MIHPYGVRGVFWETFPPASKMKQLLCLIDFTFLDAMEGKPTASAAEIKGIILNLGISSFLEICDLLADSEEEASQ